MKNAVISDSIWSAGGAAAGGGAAQLPDWTQYRYSVRTQGNRLGTD